MNSSSAKDPGHEPHQNTVIVNGRSVAVTDKELTYEQVVALSGLPTGPEASFIVTYNRGHGDKPTGSMVKGGDPVKVKDGMIFNVEPTNRS
ncbi:MAG: multiubiquitin domain-containing protein [Solirubrobacteraceae bacterium]